MATGAVEVAATGLDILNTCLPLPFPIDNERSSDNLVGAGDVVLPLVARHGC